MRRLQQCLCGIFVTIALFGAGLVFPASAVAQIQESADFSDWLAAFKAEARQAGISDPILQATFRDMQAPLQRVIDLDRRQPEGRLTFAEYRERIVSPLRIQNGIEAYQRHEAALLRVQRETGVPARIIAALWGVETSYGRITGGFHVPSALATLAYDGRRSSFFRTELLQALKILERGYIQPDQMTGSWAGAMGQPQFMPSSFLAYAVDGNGDGRRDIWNTPEDVFASAANYLIQRGWRPGELWGRPVLLPKDFDPSLVGLDKPRPLKDWHDLGVRSRASGAVLPPLEMEGAIILPDGAGGDAFVVYHNFRVLLRWNNSTYFASSVGMLADEIARGSGG